MNNLETLLTDTGIKTFYNSVSQCNRCGFCAQKCPLYVLRGEENFSPRGRNQLVRFALEEKINPEKEKDVLSESVLSCHLCGACMAECFARVPVPLHIIEAKRILKLPAGPLKKIAEAMADNFKTAKKRVFNINRSRKYGLLALLSKTAVLRLLGLKTLDAFCRFYPKNTKSVNKLLKKSGLAKERYKGKTPSAVFLAGDTAEMLSPLTAIEGLKIVNKFLGDVYLVKDISCGLIPFVHSGLAPAKKTAEKIIGKWEEISGGKNMPVITNCPDTAAFMKMYPQLFLGEDAMFGRAEKFGNNVRDIIEIIPADIKPQGKTVFDGKIITYHESAFAKNYQNISEKPVAILKNIFGENFRTMPLADMSAGAECGFPLAQTKLAEEILKMKIENIASSGADIVCALSLFDVFYLEYGLKRYYPKARCLHFSRIISGVL